MKTKATACRFAGVSKRMAPVILPTVGNLCDMYLNEKGSKDGTKEFNILDLAKEDETIETILLDSEIEEEPLNDSDYDTDVDPLKDKDVDPHKDKDVDPLKDKDVGPHKHKDVDPLKDKDVGPHKDKDVSTGQVTEQKKRKSTPLEHEEKRSKKPDPVIEIDEVPYWEVECVVDKRVVRSQPEYLVKWVGYTMAENTWEPMSSFHPLTMECLWTYERQMEYLRSQKQRKPKQRRQKHPLDNNDENETEDEDDCIQVWASATTTSLASQ